MDGNNNQEKITIETLESQLETANSEIKSLQFKYRNDLTELNSKNIALMKCLNNCEKTLGDTANQLHKMKNQLSELSEIKNAKDKYYNLYGKTIKELAKTKVEFQSYKDLYKNKEVQKVQTFKDIFLSVTFIFSIIFTFLI